MDMNTAPSPAGHLTRPAGTQKAAVTGQVPVRPGLPYEEFVHEYLNPHRPVVIPDALTEWRAVGKWTPGFFRSEFGSRELTIDGRKFSTRELIDLVERSTADRPAPYFRNEMVRAVFPELLPDVSPLPPYVLPNWFRGPFYPSAGREAEIYIGGAGGTFPILHYDSNSTHAFLAQIYGEKEAVLFPSDQAHLMYPSDGKKIRHHSRIPDVEHPDLERFPLFAQATAHRCRLRPGALLFIPSRWWHTAKMLTPSITVSFNVANASNWENVTDEICYKARCTNRLAVLPVAVYMMITGWYKALYDRVSR
jgi:hypothetical protein